jgi:autotransporter-associated beta strand protein
VLSGDNTHTGDTILQQGMLTLGHINAIGFGSLITQGSVVNYLNGVNNAASINLDSDDTQLQALAGVTATQSGAITETNGPRPLEKIGAGTLILSGANTYTGATTISGGTLTVMGGSALADGARVAVANGATLNVGVDEVIGSLSGVAGSSVTGAAGAVLTTGGDNSSTTFAGAIGGGVRLAKGGTGTFILSGANSYTGGTRIDAGTLQIDNTGALGSAAALA